MKQLKGTHLALVALAFALLGGGAATLWMRHQQKDEAKAFVSAARVERVDGAVGVGRNVTGEEDTGQWLEATTNMPVSVGDRVYARDNSSASVAFTGRNFARLDPDTSLDVMYLAPDRTQVALRDGSAIFDVGALAPDQLFEVATPFGAVDFDQPGLYQVGYNDDGNAYVSVLSGLARVVGLAGSGSVNKGEMLTLLGQTAADLVLSRLDHGYAGGLVNNYYGYRYPDTYDGRYSDYDAYLNDPNYYDPYNRYTSYQYVSDYVPGVEDLDAYGDWQDVSGYGHLWRPRVDAGWTPYQDGRWAVDDPYGMTWVSNEPWGYAPYHYGRWAFVDNQWFWVPEAVNTRPAYSPALVAFVPLSQENEVGWVPLGPGDPYVPTYYDAGWQPHYVGDAPVIRQVANMNVPGAVTVVPVQYFDGVINPRVVKRVDPRALAGVRPVLDPFAVNYLRQAALQPPKGRRPFDVPPGIARKFAERQVIASSVPNALPFMRNPARDLRVEAVPEGKKRQKLQFRDERRDDATARKSDERGRPAQAQAPATVVNDPQRSQRVNQLATEAARGDRGARRELQQLRRQEREQQRAVVGQQRQQPAQAAMPQPANDRAERQQRAQGERVGLRQQQQAQRDAERQDSMQRAQAAAAQREQQRAQRQQERQVRQQQGPPPQARREQPRPQPQAQRPQPQPQMRQQQQQGPPARPNVERRQGPPQKSAGPPQSEKHGDGGGGGKGKGKGRP
ncbi:MAG TPA: DUF6600 domain-containing protein [Pyrinomonadaceae bacterium]|jgi:hypothetical protein|nr:DUF6600 domain-containing protein [Pyrinomonadaceae bacterium]